MGMATLGQRNALSDLKLDEILRLSDHDIVERFLYCYPCPMCRVTNKLQLTSGKATKQEDHECKKLGIHVRCKSCGARGKLDCITPKTPEAYDKIFFTGVGSNALKAAGLGGQGVGVVPAEGQWSKKEIKQFIRENAKGNRN
jgi:hypothetical protein